jgi:hypothetical protein
MNRSRFSPAAEGPTADRAPGVEGGPSVSAEALPDKLCPPLRGLRRALQLPRLSPLCMMAACLVTTAISAAPAPKRPDATADAPATAEPPVAAFDTFQSIGNLNIFNPNRVAWNPGGPRPEMETIGFVGTMESAKGTLAFFDSSNRTYRKAVPVGGAIAEFTVARIEASKVELTRDSKPLTLSMGQQLRRPPGGDWAPGPVSRIVAQETAAASAPAIPADASDIVKRMMEKRLQQTK